VEEEGTMTIDPRPAHVDLVVTAKNAVADAVVTLELRHPEGRRLPDWAPGAHVDLVLPNGLTRQYSLCGDRWDAHSYRIGVLREPVGRGGSAYVHDQLRVGDPVAIGGPRNNFRLVPAEDYLFIAGGIGITPLLPMVHQAELLGARWRLLYGGRSRATMAFLDELARYGAKVAVSPQDEQGLLPLSDWLPSAGSATRVYCCGPEGLLATVERRCADYPVGQLRTERFVPRQNPAPARTEPFQLELCRSGRTVEVAPGQSVLDALADAGVHVLSSCRRGVCGTCETTVIAGEPDHRDSLLDDDERAAGDCMFVCVSSALSDRLVLDL
jgi:ferredoxin-NADP reductase